MAQPVDEPPSNVSLVQIMLQFAKTPARDGNPHPTEALNIMARVCEAVTRHTGCTMMTRSLRILWVATKQVEALIQNVLPSQLRLHNLPPISVFGMGIGRTLAPLQEVLIDPNDGQYVKQHLTIALTTLTELQDMYFVEHESENLILADAKMLLLTMHLRIALQGLFSELNFGNAAHSSASVECDAKNPMDTH